jgi:septal ring factor EnvC (AmiA/AmiB activator)
MSRDFNHFRGESFGTPFVDEVPEDEYLQTLIAHYKSCLLLEKSGKSPESLSQHFQTIEREVALLDNWNTKLEELLELKDLEIERLNEDLRYLDEDLKDTDHQCAQLEERLEKLQENNQIKDAILNKQDLYLKDKEEFTSPVMKTHSYSKIDRKSVAKTSRNRYESPTLV